MENPHFKVRRIIELDIFEKQTVELPEGNLDRCSNPHRYKIDTTFLLLVVTIELLVVRSERSFVAMTVLMG